MWSVDYTHHMEAGGKIYWDVESNKLVKTGEKFATYT
jgi:hypothetical protein